MPAGKKQRNARGGRLILVGAVVVIAVIAAVCGSPVWTATGVAEEEPLPTITG